MADETPEQAPAVNSKDLVAATVSDETVADKNGRMVRVKRLSNGARIVTQLG